MPTAERDRSRRVGRHAPRGRTDVGTRPGRILLVALLAAAPVVALFIVGPVLHRESVAPITVMPFWRAWFLFGTPVLTVASLTLYYRSPPDARAHNAARFGRTLAIANAGLWLLYASLYLAVLRHL